MKYLIISDIHGSASCCDKAINQFEKLGCDMIICLGDVLYHGARNPLPEGYDNPSVADILNPYADKMICCRGNCDCEVCEMVLDFPLMQDYNIIVDGGIRMLATHGHVISPINPKTDAPVVPGSRAPHKLGWDILLYGHTHIPVLMQDDMGRIICNPGSTTLPKNGSDKGFAVYENGTIALHTLGGAIIKELALR